MENLRVLVLVVINVDEDVDDFGIEKNYIVLDKDVDVVEN